MSKELKLLPLPNGKVEDIKRLTDPVEREPYEDEMEDAVRRVIASARKGITADLNTIDGWSEINAVYHSAILVKSALESQSNDENSFGSWNPWIRQLLGPNDCQNIGVRTCGEEKFTVEEAEQILVNYPNPKHPGSNI